MHYLAYGSNLHPLRLTQRTPGARLVGSVQLDGYLLCFNKRSVDGSAKCNLDYTALPVDRAYGAVFDLPENEVGILDDIEGVGQGYFRQQLAVVVNNEPIAAFTYFATQSHLVYDLPAYDWYQELVLMGAAWHGFPPEYIRRINDIPAMKDGDPERRATNRKLLAQIRMA